MTRTHRRVRCTYLAIAATVTVMAALVGGCDSGDDDKPGYLDVLVRSHKRGFDVVQCRTNLHALGRALHLYAAEHDGRFPASLNDLVKAGLIGSEAMLKCPPGDGVPYIYTPPATMRAPMSTIILRDSGPVHLGKVNVLYLNGSVEAISAKDAEAKTPQPPKSQ